MLEKAVREAQNCESKISHLQDWVTRVDLLLTEHIENDVGIEDLPHDFQRLMDEFATNEQSIVDMVDQISLYQKNNKFEAAKRLDQQMKLLTERFGTCKMKLDKFKSPQSGFESRLNRAMGELRNIERSSIVIDISSGKYID